MRITLLCIGKNQNKEIENLIAIYEKRLKNYVNFERKVIPSLKNLKNLSPDEIKHKEGKEFVKHLSIKDKIILLDEKGQHYTSQNWADWMNKQMLYEMKNLVFVIGGAYGFSKEIIEISHQRLAFSKMTFSHQVIRIFFMEQLYRCFTLINNHPYHNN